jgi:hypothetical protein
MWTSFRVSEGRRSNTYSPACTRECMVESGELRQDCLGRWTFSWTIWMRPLEDPGNFFDLSCLSSNAFRALSNASASLAKRQLHSPSRQPLQPHSLCHRYLAIVSAIMSDYEDEMDVDAPAAQSSIQFSSNSNEKGKRSAANLPVELQDTLPWYVSLHCQ